jgi:glutathione S-transferase
MSDQLVFYTRPMSRGRIVRWMLEEIVRPYETDLMEGENALKTPEYLKINPMGKVPALRHGDVVVTETGAICAYLADAFPEAGLAPPPGDPLRGPYYRWMFFAAGPIDGAIVAHAMGHQVPPERRPMSGWGSMDSVMGAIETALSNGDYLLGDRFSAADVYFGAHLGWGTQFGAMERTPAIEAYVARTQGRPAAKRAKEIDDSLMPAQPQPEAADA